MKKYILLPIAAIVFLIAGCEKLGLKGEDGANGATIIGGAGLPSVILGKDGDFFFDTVGAVVWGPKQGSNWGNGRAISGKSVLNGNGAPNNALGVDGDFYLDIATSTLYGPKAGGAWGAGTSLKGATGSANVIYSDWVTSPTASKDTTIDGTCLRVRHFTAASLTDDIKNKGVMITYFRVGSIGPYQLPYISEAGGATNQINCVYATKKITVYRHTYNTCRFNSGIAESYPGQPVMVNLPQSLEYRYVLIPGAIPGGGPKPVNETEQIKVIQLQDGRVLDLNNKSYEETCKALGIQP